MSDKYKTNRLMLLNQLGLQHYYGLSSVDLDQTNFSGTRIEQTCSLVDNEKHLIISISLWGKINAIDASPTLVASQRLQPLPGPFFAPKHSPGVGAYCHHYLKTVLRLYSPSNQNDPEVILAQIYLNGRPYLAGTLSLYLDACWTHNIFDAEIRFRLFQSRHGRYLPLLESLSCKSCAVTISHSRVNESHKTPPVTSLIFATYLVFRPSSKSRLYNTQRMQRRTHASRPKWKLSQFVVSQDSEGWMNASLSGTDGNSRAANHLSGPMAAGNGENFNSSRHIAARTGGITTGSPVSVRPEPTRRYSVPYLGYQRNQGHDENQRPVVTGPQRTQVVSGTHPSNGNSLLQQSRTVSHPTISKPTTYTGTPSQHGRPMPQADPSYQQNPARPSNGPQRRLFVPLDNISEETLSNGGGFPSFYLLPDTGLRGVDTSMTPISGSPHDRTQNDTSPVIDETDENVERIMRALQYHSNELPGDNHRDSRLFQLLSVAIPYQAVVMPRPTSLDNALTDKVTIQIPPTATEIMDQGDDKMDELGRTLLDHLLSFACTASMLTKIVLQVLRQAESRYGPHAETQLRTSIAGILMTAFRQYFVGEGLIISDRLSITLAEVVGEFFVAGLLDSQDFFLALDTLLAPSAHNRIAAMGAMFGCCNDVLFALAHVELFQAFCAKLTQHVNGVYVHSEGTRNGQAIIMGIVGRLRSGFA